MVVVDAEAIAITPTRVWLRCFDFDCTYLRTRRGVATLQLLGFEAEATAAAQHVGPLWLCVHESISIPFH